MHIRLTELLDARRKREGDGIRGSFESGPRGRTSLVVVVYLPYLCKRTSTFIEVSGQKWVGGLDRGESFPR